MTSPEGEMYSSAKREFQPVIKREDIASSPFAIVRQTYSLLELLYHGPMPDPDPARNYLQKYTLTYLKNAQEGMDTIYNNKGTVYKDWRPNISEAAHHAFIVFAFLPDRMTSRFLPNGFSRKGMLRAPETKEEFNDRLDEIKVGISQVVDGRIESQPTLFAHPRLLRTYGFFNVGSRLPIKVPADENKKQKMENLDRLLSGIDTTL